MGLMNELAGSGGFKLVELGSLQLIRANDFLAFVALCKRHRFAIVGIEGFFVREGKAVPDMDAIADFSEIQDDNVVDGSAQAAEDFFRNIEPLAILFDFVLAQRTNG